MARPLSSVVLVVAALPSLVTVLALSGCTAPMSVQAGDASSPTGGVAIVFQERDVDELRFRRYELDADGTLRIGGGRSAQRMTTDWTGTASAEQIASILSAARTANLESGEIACQTDPNDQGEPVRTTIEYAWPDGRRRLDLVGNCPSILPLRDVFESIGRARFQRHLDQLPEAGPQPRR
ncbi:MAG: hypothetical protein JNM94_01670 [Phycisphaerae bacterium]|nr:hypothetical protein [Phycisphaerae bacterium]